MPGRILNLSLGGCRIRTEERFNVGIYVRVEAEFYLHGLPFRVGGVSQAILDKNTIGVRFLDMSGRRREQLEELIAEIAEAAQEPDSGLTGIVDRDGQDAQSVSEQ
jgi:c-di-GMP-binding flagellar brake protein YcgR